MKQIYRISFFDNAAGLQACFVFSRCFSTTCFHIWSYGKGIMSFPLFRCSLDFSKSQGMSPLPKTPSRLSIFTFLCSFLETLVFIIFILKLSNCAIHFLVSFDFKIVSWDWKPNFKLVSVILCQIFIFSLNDSPSKTMKNVFYFI